MSALKIQKAGNENLPALYGKFSLGLDPKEGQTEEMGAPDPDPHMSDCVFKNTKAKTKTKQKKNPTGNQMKQINKKMLETRKLKAGRTEPEHKNGSGDSGSNAGLVCPDYYGPARLSGSREAPVAPGVAASERHGHGSELSTTGSSRPRRGASGEAHKNSLYESVLLNQWMEWLRKLG